MALDLTQFEFRVLQAVADAARSEKATRSSHDQARKGWLTVTEIRDFSSLEIQENVRPALIHLANSGFLSESTYSSIRHFRLNNKGEQLLESGLPEISESLIIDSRRWTGIIEYPQVQRVLVILTEMEDVCEKIKNNSDRSQIFGLIRALQILLNIPEPPRQGVVALARDPAFANIVSVGTFLAALIAAVRP